MNALTFSGNLSVVTAVPAATANVFRNEKPVAFTVASAGERISIDAAASVIAGRFEPFEYNAVTIGPPFRASLENSGEFVLVTLDAPRQLVRAGTFSARAEGIVLTAAANLGNIVGGLNFTDSIQLAHGTVEVFRVDGKQPADKPTVSTFEGFDFDQEFTDVKFALRFKDATGAVTPVTAASVKEIAIRGFPTGPRIGIADRAGTAPPVFFFQAPGEIKPGAPGDKGSVPNAAAADQFQIFVDRALDGAPAGPFPRTIDATLVIESDSPCRFNGAQFGIEYHRVVQTFDSDPKDKRALRFNGASAAQEVSVRLPRSANVVSAAVKVLESFAPGAASANPAAPPLTVAPPETVGALIEAGFPLAQLVSVDAPFRATGVALAFTALEANTAVSVELREDAQGQPSGRVLAEGRIELGGIGVPAWSALRFDAPVALQTGSYWVVAILSKGLAVWLGTATDSGRVLRGDTAITERSLLFQFLSADALAQSGSAPWSVTIGSQVVEPGPSDNGTHVFDAASAINAFLQASSGTEVTVPLRFTSGLPGTVTVFAPKVIFDA